MKKLLIGAVGLFAGSIAMGQAISTFPYNEDFEGEGSSTSCGGYVMVAAGWNNDLSDGNDWSADFGGTGSGGTGPGVDFNPGTASGRYMYTETSGCSNDVRNLETPWFDFTATSGMEMNFAYHMLGATMGTMSVDYRTGMADAWTELVAPFTDNVDLWQTSVSDITFLSGNDSVQFRIVANTGTSFTSDMAIDDFNVFETVFNGSIASIEDVTCFGDANGSLTVAYEYAIEPVTFEWDTGDPADTLSTLSGVGAGTYCCTMIDAADDTVIVCGEVFDTLATTALELFAHTPTEWICTDSMGLLVIDSITGGVPAAIDCGLSTYGCSGAVDSVQVDTVVASQFGVGGTQYPSPLGNWYWGTRHQISYSAYDLLSAGVEPGNISGMAFFVESLGSAATALSSWTIKMGCAPAGDSVLTAFNNDSPVEVLAPADITITTGWNWFTFDTPFYWNGTDALIVETCFNNSAFTNNPTMTVEPSGYTSVVYYRADNATVCGTSTITGTSANRPIARFENCSVELPYNYIYSWDTGATTDTTSVLGGTYTLTVEDGIGCVQTLDVTINESAPVNIDDITICEGNPNDFMASGTFESYSWNTGESTQTISITTGGTYYVDAVDSLGCPSSDTAFVSTLPTPVISATSSDVMFGSDGYIDLLVYGAAFPFTIDWDNDGTGDNDDTEDQFGLDAGTYTVVVTDTNGCYSTLTIEVHSQLGVEDLENLFNIYPNPTSDVLNIQSTSILDENARAELTDASGRVITNMTLGGKDITTVDFSELERGIYFINIYVGESMTTTKVVKQ